MITRQAYLAHSQTSQFLFLYNIWEKIKFLLFRQTNGTQNVFIIDRNDSLIFYQRTHKIQNVVHMVTAYKLWSDSRAQMTSVWSRTDEIEWLLVFE